MPPPPSPQAHGEPCVGPRAYREQLAAGRVTQCLRPASTPAAARAIVDDRHPPCLSHSVPNEQLILRMAISGIWCRPKCCHTSTTNRPTTRLTSYLRGGRPAGVVGTSHVADDPADDRKDWRKQKGNAKDI